MTQKQITKQETILTLAHSSFGKDLNAYAFFKVHNHNVGQDLVQDTFLKTWKYMAKGGKIDIMKAFLYHVLNNLIVDEYRKKRDVTSLDTMMEKGFEPSVNDSDRLFDALDGKEASLLIGNLPIKYKNVMRMRYIQELSLKEIALITGQTQNTVAVQTHRGLEKLKLLYKPLVLSGSNMVT